MIDLAINGGIPVRNSRLPIFRLEIDDSEYQAIAAVLKLGQISRGNKPQHFEQTFCDYIGAKHSVVVSSGTAALHLAVQALELPPDSEVIVPSLSFVATAFCIEYCGLKPVFAEIEPTTFNISPEGIEEKITSNTRAIIPVHYAGRPCNMAQIKEIANKFDLIIIEDAAHAIGARYSTQTSEHQSNKVGSCYYSHLTTFSFFATKNITAGEGGMVTTNSEKLAHKIRRMKAHGIVPLEDSPKASGYYDVKSIGYNYHLSNLNIALLEAQLYKLETLTAKRKENAAYLTSLLKDLKGVYCPQYDDGYDHVYHLYTIQVDLNLIRASRDELVTALLAEGIQVGVYYRPIHLFTYFREKYGYQRGHLPITEKVTDSLITLPMYPSLTRTELEQIAKAMHKIITFYRK